MADSVPADLKYTQEHEWARQDGPSLVTVGVTFHAQTSLGDVVYVELPKEGATLVAGKQFGVIESTKAVSDLYSPLSGKVVKINQAVIDEPETINEDPYGEGWLIQLEPSDSKELAKLLDAGAYQELLK